MHTLQILHVVVLYTILCLVDGQVQFRVIRQWKYLNYTWPDSETLSKAKSNGQYIPANIVTSGIVYYNDDYYLTMPRMKDGVPATLGKITAKSGGSAAPLITPFPSWEFNQIGNCSALQNVQNVEINLDGKMWIIDGGHVGSLTATPNKNCPPKLIIFDIEQNFIETEYIFPDSVVGRNGNYLYDLVIDDDFAYITDNSARDPGIVVFSRKNMTSWKIRHSKSMRGDASITNFKVNDVRIPNPVNLAGIALSPKDPEGKKGRILYYSAISSLRLYSISTLALQDEANSNDGMDYAGEVTEVGLKKSESDGMTMSNKGVLYYGLLADNSIAKWDSHNVFANNQMVLTRDLKYVQWTNRLTIDDKGNLVVLTSTLQDFIFRELDTTKYNFYVLSASINEKIYLSDYVKPLDDNSNLTVQSTTEHHVTEQNLQPTKTTKTPNHQGKAIETNEIMFTSSSTKNELNMSAGMLITVILCFYHKYY